MDTDRTDPVCHKRIQKNIPIINKGAEGSELSKVESNIATSGNRLGFWGDPHLSQRCRRQDLPTFSPLNDFRGRYNTYKYLGSPCPS